MVILLAEPFAESARRVLTDVGEVVDWDETRLADADAVVTGLEIHLRKPLLDRMPRLRVIASRTSQLRHLDLEEAERRGIEVLSIDADAPALQETSSTAEETFALLLALVRNVPWAFDALKNERWERRRYGGRELKGKTLGVIGYGRLGRMVADYARAFGMRVLVNSPGEDGVTLDELLRESDVVSVHCTYDETTRGLLGEDEFRSMKPTAYFVNTARGEITDERALLKALEEGWIAGAAVDTLADEQPDGSHLRGNPLVEYARRHENLIVLPHLGGATQEATERTQTYIAEKLADWLRR
jgi:D-3-phosphoglycerate dehydrogenase / 2-oxoglutarate reductase